MKWKCLLGHLPAFDNDSGYFICVRCKKLLVQNTMGNTERPPLDKYNYEKRCRFCDIPFVESDNCPKCDTILYHWVRLNKKNPTCRWSRRMKENMKLLLWTWLGTLSLFLWSLLGLLLKIDHIYLQKEIFELGFVCGTFLLVFVIISTVICFPQNPELIDGVKE